MNATPGTFVWHDLLTPDAEGSIAFYGALFGWTIREKQVLPGITARIFHSGDQPVGGCVQMSKAEIAEGWPPHWTQYVCVESLDEAMGRAVEAGGKLAHDAIDVPGWGRFTFVTAPGGATCALWQKLG